MQLACYNPVAQLVRVHFFKFTFHFFSGSSPQLQGVEKGDVKGLVAWVTKLFGAAA
jgi:hypothetical protein